MRRLVAAGLAAVAALALTACSQVAALTPVSGGPLTSVRNASYDVLVAQQVQILVAPVCTAAGTGFTCTGSTVDGKDITVEASGTTPYPMTVKVGGSVVFEGNAVDVLQQAVLEGS